MKLARKLLDDCHADLEKDVRNMDPEYEQSMKFGLTYTSDGWESCDHLPLINNAYILAGNGGV